MKHNLHTLRPYRLYNIIFPLFFFFFIPFSYIWLAVVFGNLIIDCLILALCLKAVRPQKWKSSFRKCWWRIWLCGYGCDLIGTLFLLAIYLIPAPTDQALFAIQNAIAYNPWSSVAALLCVCLAILIAGVAIYYFDSRILSKRTSLPVSACRRISLILAILTAPYLMLLPLPY